MKLFKMLIFFIFVNIQYGNCQIGCQVFTSEIDGISLMFEYNKEYILNNKPLKYKRDLHRRDTVDIVDLIGSYAIVVIENDTFAVKCGSLKSNCDSFNEYAYRSNLEEATKKYNIISLGLLPKFEEVIALKNIFIQGVNKKRKNVRVEKDSILTMIGLVENTAYILYENDIYSTSIEWLSNDRIEQIKQDEILAKKKKLEDYISELSKDKLFFKARKYTYVPVTNHPLLYDVFSNLSCGVAIGELLLIGIKDDMAYVFYKDRLCRTDYISLSSPVLDSLCIVKENYENAEKKKIVQKQKINNENRRQRMIEKYGEKAANYIMKGSVYIGMTKDMAIEAWGKPTKVNTTTTAYGVHEQWVYGNSNYLYFDDGKLTSIQN